MEVYTPAFNKIRELLQEKILNFIGENIVVNTQQINEFILKLKQENKNQIQGYKLVFFSHSYPYSHQIEDLLIDLTRRCVIEQTRKGYTLTSYGLSLIGNDI